MVKGKINMISLIVIIILVLLLGIGIGYVVFSNVGEVVKSANAKQDGFIELESKYNTLGRAVGTTSEENIIRNTIVYNEVTNTVSNTISTTNPNVIETTKYDGNKSITINGKVYTISYKNELNNSYEVFDDGAYYDVTLYFNDVKLKTYKHKGFFYGMLEYMDELELYSILGGYDKTEEFIVIALNSGHQSGNIKDFCIINIDGEIMGLCDYNTFTGISEKSTGKNLTYEINKDGIVLYDVTSANENFMYAVVKYKISVNSYGVYQTIEKGYTSDEVMLAGK